MSSCRATNAKAGLEPTQENVIKAALVLIAERLKKREAIRGR